MYNSLFYFLLWKKKWDKKYTYVAYNGAHTVYKNNKVIAEADSQNLQMGYRTRTNITRSWSVTALVYKLRILGFKKWRIFVFDTKMV